MSSVAFHFGPFYGQNVATFGLEPGDAVCLVVSGAPIVVHVAYGAAVTN